MDVKPAPSQLERKEDWRPLKCSATKEQRKFHGLKQFQMRNFQQGYNDLKTLDTDPI